MELCRELKRGLTFLGLVIACFLYAGNASAVAVPMVHTVDEQSIAQLNLVLQKNIELLSMVIRNNIRRLAFAATGVALVYIGLSMVRDQLKNSPHIQFPGLNPEEGRDFSHNVNTPAPIDFFSTLSPERRKQLAILFGLGSVGVGLGCVLFCDRL